MKSNQHKVNKHNRPVHEYEIPTPLILIIKKKKKKLKLDLMKEINYIWMSISSKPNKKKKKLYMNVKQYAKLDDGRTERTSLIVFIDEGNKNWPG